jgi:hypothetical protein
MPKDTDQGNDVLSELGATVQNEVQCEGWTIRAAEYFRIEYRPVSPPFLGLPFLLRSKWEKQKSAVATWLCIHAFIVADHFGGGQAAHAHD